MAERGSRNSAGVYSEADDGYEVPVKSGPRPHQKVPEYDETSSNVYDVLDDSAGVDSHENDGYEVPVTRSKSGRRPRQKVPEYDETSPNVYDVLDDSDNPRQIKVTDFDSSKCSEDFFLNYFENKRTFGPDLTVEEVNFERDFAVVTFKYAKHAATVMRVHQTKPCKFNKRKLGIEYYQPSSSADDDDDRTIEVRGFDSQTEDDLIMLYFEKCRNAGGSVEHCIVSEDRKCAHITFEKSGVADNVLKKEHTIAGCRLNLRKIIISKTEILLSNVSPNATEEHIRNYCEARMKQEVIDVKMDEKRMKALIVFTEPIDFKKAEKACRGQQLQGHTLTLSSVPVTDSIIVKDVTNDHTHDSILFYFENVTRSHGGPVYDVKFDPDLGYCIVSFNDPKVVEAVCAKEEHVVSDICLKVAPYQACLGLPAGSENQEMVFPDPVSLQSLGPLKLTYLQKMEEPKEKFVKMLEDHHAVVSWDSPFPRVECGVSSSVRDFRKILKSWMENVRKVIDDFDANCEVKEFHFDSDELDDIKQELNAVHIDESENVVVKIDTHNKLINIVVERGCSDNVILQIQQAIQKGQQEYKTKKERKTERKTFSNRLKVKFLKVIGFADRMKQKYAHVDVEINIEASEVVVSGPQRSISGIFVTAFELTEQINEKRVPMEKGKIVIVSHQGAFDKINEEMKGKGLGETWEVSNSEVVLYAEDENDLARMENVIDCMLTQTTVDVDKQVKHLIDSKEWKELEAKLHRECLGCIYIDNNDEKLVVYTIVENKDNVDIQIQNFFTKNATFKEEITMEANIVKFIGRHMKHDFDSEMNSAGKKLKYDLQQSKVIIEGTAKLIKAAKGIVRKFEGEVRCKPNTIKKRGIYLYISSEKGKESIRNVEISASCIIDVMGKGLGSSMDKRKSVKGRNFVKPMNCAECTVKSGQKVIVFGGDMTTLGVDVLVNSSNKDMHHVGGLAAVIVKKGGSMIQRECTDHVKQNGSLNFGDVYLSGSGDLKSSAAIAHAVGPIWHDGNKGESKNLEKAIKNCLIETEKVPYGSIAFPALGAGIFGYPIDQACSVITSTVKTYFKDKPKSKIKEVYLCDINIKTAKAFIEAAQAEFKHCKVIADLGSPTNKPQAWLTTLGESSDQDRSPKSPFGTINVKVVKGDMVKEKVDVIVNSCSSDLDLAKGRSSEALSKAGGSKIQDECRNNYPNGIQTGEVAITTGGKLACKKMFHIALEAYKNHKTMHPLQGLKKSMMECLIQAQTMGFTSLSFPAMGTGYQRYPRDKVASEMFSTLANYYKKNPRTCITNVHFVIFSQDDDTYNAFLLEERRLNGQEDGRQDPRGPSTSATFVKVVTNKKDYGEFDVGSMKVKVYQGDITEQDTVAIVASSNSDLDLNKGQVSQAIRNKGGPEVEQDCKGQKSEMKRTGIAVTTAGQLKSQYIVHVETKYKLKDWEPVILKCLREAEKKKFGSLAFPALGTNLGCKPRAIGCMLAEALCTFHGDSQKYLRKICVVVYQKEMLEPFIDGMKSSLLSSQSAGHSSRPSSAKRSNDQNRRSHDSFHGNESKAPCMDDTCSMTIYGRSDRDIETAVKQLNKHIEDNWFVKPIKDSSIASLKTTKIDEIKDCSKKNHVLVDVDHDGCVITLTGSPIGIITVTDKINKITHAFDKSQQDKRLAKLVTNVIKWFYVKGTKSFPFPDRENLKIETAFEKKDKSVRIDDHSGGKYEIDFNNMEEWNVKTPNEKFPVIRKDLIKEVGHETPKHWTVMAQGQQVMVIALSPTDKEYKDVEQLFTATLGRKPTIKKIERIQNATLYTQYVAKKRQMDSSNSRKRNEKILWHGTDIKAVDSINNHGFNRSYCGKNATALGAGVYFAVNASYSDQGTYTPVDSNGYKHMYRAKVLSGDYTTGNASLRVPPVKDPANPHILFDSVTNNTSNPMMFVIFHDTQAYPEHIITYK